MADTEERCAVHGQLEPCLGCAGERIAVRDGVTPDDVRERVRRGGELAGDDVRTDANTDGVRTCALDGCATTFVPGPRNPKQRFCKPAHRAAAYRVRAGGAS